MTRRPVAVTMFVVALAVFGFVSLEKLPVDLLPEISYPTLTVRTAYPGAAPEDVEDRVSVRIQEALSTLPRLVRSSSTSRAESSDVVLDFDWGTPMTFAVQDVRDRLDGVFLPQGTERPLILRYDPKLDPVLRIGFVSPRGEDERALVHLRWLAEKRVKRELETLPGVAAVLVRGGLREEIRVRVDPSRLAAQGLAPARVAERLAQENLNASGGLIREGSTTYLVRALNEFTDLEEIADLALERRGQAVIRLRDVATVERTHAEREVVTRIGGRDAVEIAVFREAGANVVDVAERVRSAIFGTARQQAAAKELSQREGEGRLRTSVGEREQVDYLAWRLRDEARFELLSDQSTFIREAIADVRSAALMGAVLAVVVIWFSLRRLSSTVIIAIAIPISVIVTFVPMYLFGVSLNVMSLGGLALGVGMLVDNAIVVLESITRCREEGDDPVRAAVRGAREVVGAISASTLTTICVFAPIVFVHGVAGRIFGDQALTVVTSLVVSLLVATLFIPMLASRRFLQPGAAAARGRPAELARAELAEAGRALALVPPRQTGLWRARPLYAVLALLRRALLVSAALATRALAGLGLLAWNLLRLVLAPLGWLFDRLWMLCERAYPPLLSGALAAPWVVLLAVSVLGFLAARRVSTLGLDLLPEIHQGEFTARVGLEVGSPLSSTEAVLAEIDGEVRALQGVLLTALVVGVEKETLTREIEGEHTARLTVRLDPAWLSDAPARGESPLEAEERLTASVRRIVAGHPAVRALDVRRPTPFALEAPVQVEVLGHDLEQLAQTASEVVARLARLPGLSDVESSVRAGHPEALVVFDRDKLLEYGLDLAAVSGLVRDQVLGTVGTRFVEGDDRIDVRVLGDELELSTLERVLELVVNPQAATPMPLRSIASARIVQGPAEIRRVGNSRAVVIDAAASGIDLGGLATSIEGALRDLVPPEEVVVRLGGQKREMDEAQSSMRFALLLALFLVYVVMACQFESLLQPLIILLTAPLAGVGVVLALDLLELPLSVVVFIGLILLAGIVVNNAIVLLDRVNQTRARGLALREALLEAGRVRLRPIYMTTATTVLGLLPLTGWLEGLPLVGALSGGQGAELRAPMAITVIAGLSCSSLLTLIVIPTVYYLAYLPGERRRLRSAA